MRRLHIIMPMAGAGSRFTKEGWTIPKPLIELHGKKLYQRALDSVNVENIPIKYSFIVRKEHIELFEIDQQIKAYVDNASIFAVEKTTRGAVETCLLAQKNILDDEAILILDCDLEFVSQSFNEEIRTILNKSVDEVDGGVLVSFNSNEPKYSYALVDENNFVIRTAEKEVISSNALCGAYFFSNAKSFLYSANKLINEIDFIKPELYLSLLYNYLIEDSEKVKLCTIDDYYSYGTPSELKQFL